MVTRRTWAAGASVVLTTLTLAACGTTAGSGGLHAGSATKPPAKASAGVDPAASRLVPAEIRARERITVASDASYAPDEFMGRDGHTVVGMDPDLVRALGRVLGLKVTIVNATFDTILPGLAARKYDLAASSFTDSKAREQTFDFVDYFIAGESFFTKTSGGTSVTGLADLCGHTVAVEKGTTELADAEKQSQQCRRQGRPGVTVLAFADQTGANLALMSGRAQLAFADSPLADYQVKQSNGQFKLVGVTYANAPYGLVTRKGSTLDKALLVALKDLMRDGTYTAILTRWGLQAGAIPRSQARINGATS